MTTRGWIIHCPECGAKIDEFSLCDEWWCDCGASGIFEPPDDDTELDDDSEQQSGS